MLPHTAVASPVNMYFIPELQDSFCTDRGEQNVAGVHRVALRSARRAQSNAAAMICYDQAVIALLHGVWPEICLDSWRTAAG